MSLKTVRIHLEAQREMEESFERYRQESEYIALRFLADIRSSLKKIQKTPRLYPPYTKNTRRRILGSFPYSVIFSEREDVILVVAVAHGKRREGYWAERLNQ